MILTVCPRCASEQEARPKFESCHACGYFGVMYLREGSIREQEESLAELAKRTPNELPASDGRRVQHAL